MLITLLLAHYILVFSSSYSPLLPESSSALDPTQVVYLVLSSRSSTPICGPPSTPPLTHSISPVPAHHPTNTPNSKTTITSLSRNGSPMTSSKKCSNTPARSGLVKPSPQGLSRLRRKHACTSTTRIRIRCTSFERRAPIGGAGCLPKPGRGYHTSCSWVNDKDYV